MTCDCNRDCDKKLQREKGWHKRTNNGNPNIMYEGMNGNNGMNQQPSITGWDAFWLFISTIIVLIIMLVILGFVVEISWNVVMPDVFNLRQIDLGQGIALFILAALLIGGNRFIR
jgi:hypothetical protein